MLKYLYFNAATKLKVELVYDWIDGLRFYARRGDAGIVGNIYFGLYEFSESMFLLHFLRERDTFLDVGANLGHYSLLASGLNGCHSIAIEPIPRSFSQLRRQIALNKLDERITAKNIGLGGQVGNLFFSSDRGTMNRIVDEEYDHSVEVSVDTVDNICASREIDAMKIDVEGYEKYVLSGSSSTLKRDSLKAVIIEINQSNQFYGVESDEVSNALVSEGFNPFSYNPLDRKLTRLMEYNKDQFNTIFVRDISYVQSRLDKSRPIKIWNQRI